MSGRAELKGAAAEMLEKLGNTRAGASSGVMDNQAAFNAGGMLMLESIQNKGDPNDEAAKDDEETMRRLAGERVK